MFEKIHKKIYQFYSITKTQRDIKHILALQNIDSVYNKELQKNPDSLLPYGFKVFSQCDEDGIIEKIFDEIGTTNKTFVEIGSGDGSENNTHYLLLKGWKGVWIDGSESRIAHAKKTFGVSKRLDIVHSFLDKDNAEQTLLSSLTKIGEDKIDFLSIDIDGNDIHVLEALKDIDARMICMEYNPAFRPPLAISVKYDEKHTWKNDIYHGSSLQAFYDVLSKRGYALVSCNLSGYNSFFVKQSELKNLKPLTPKEAYQPSRLWTVHLKHGHKVSNRFLQNELKN